MSYPDDLEKIIQRHDQYSKRLHRRIHIFSIVALVYVLFAMAQFINLAFYNNQTMDTISNIMGLLLNSYVIYFSVLNWRDYILNKREAEAQYSRLRVGLNPSDHEGENFKKARSKIGFLYGTTILWCFGWICFLVTRFI